MHNLIIEEPDFIVETHDMTLFLNAWLNCIIHDLIVAAFEIWKCYLII